METAYDNDGKYLGKLADVFGDPTRRSIYRHLRGHPEPLSAGEISEVFGVHRTVARAHLEKLAVLGLVECGTRRRASGGRPAKTYVISGQRLEIMLPPRRYERLSRLLLRLIESTSEPEAAGRLAFALGRELGAETVAEIAEDGAQPPVGLAPRAAVAWMDEAGYSVSLDDGASGVVAVEVRNCVYSELAAEFPDIVCPLDRGMVCGLLGIEPSAHTQTHSMSAGDEYCRHELRL